MDSLEQGTYERASTREMIHESIVGKFLSGNCFYPVLQPIYRIQNTSIVGYEFLTRSTIPSLKMPDAFFAFCRDNDILNAVDLRCFEMCIKTAGSMTPDFRNHINLFPSTLQHLYLDRLLDILRRFKPSEALCIELNAQLCLDAHPYFERNLKALRDTGSKIAISGVGFNKNAPQYLRTLNPDIIKIDRRLIKNISHDSDRRKSFKKMMEMIQGLRAEVIAEGIERQEDRDALVKLGITFGQGFLWGQPEEI